MWQVNRQGCTRIVLLVGEYAIKLPNALHGWPLFLQGLLANINERKTWTASHSELLCPVLWSSWGGWLLVMRRAVPCRWLDEGGEEIDYSRWIVEGFGGDDKPTNYGVLNGHVVKLDYGQPASS
jgi:hypothetical protein